MRTLKKTLSQMCIRDRFFGHAGEQTEHRGHTYP